MCETSLDGRLSNRMVDVPDLGSGFWQFKSALGYLVEFISKMLHVLFNESLLMSASISSIFIPTIALAVAVGVIFFSHPVHNLLSLIFVFFISCGLLILVGAEFAAFLFLIVYVGAIMILFLFVIMLLNLNKIISLEQAVLPDSAFLITSTSLIILFSFEAAISSAIHTFFVSTEIVSTLDISSANSLK